MESYGFWSLVPPLIAIVLAIWTRQVYISLLSGIWLGWMVLSGWDPIRGSLDTIEALVDVFKDAGSTRTIMFSALVGAIIIFIQRSGGVQAFIDYLDKKLTTDRAGDQTKKVQWLAMLTGIVVFVESSVSVLTVGTLFRPVFDRLKISREKLAYIADSSSAPVCILIPFNAWGAFIMGLLLVLGYDAPFSILMKSIIYNFYPMLALAMVAYIIWTKRDFGPMKKAEARAAQGKILWEDAIPMVSEDLTSVDTKEGIKPKIINMVLPIGIMVMMMPVMLAYTGWHTTEEITGGVLDKLFHAIGQGSGSTSVLVSVILAIIVSGLSYRLQGIFKLNELVDLSIKGIAGLMPLALLMLMAFAINAVCKELHTGQYIADITQSWLSPGLVPFIAFITSAFIAFSTGTSWGTFGIMLAIAVPMAQSLGAHEIMTIAAVLGGGVFGDHCSPISDTTIIASMASATDHIDHVKTQLPYAIVTGVMTAVIYLVVGLV